MKLRTNFFFLVFGIILYFVDGGVLTCEKYESLDLKSLDLATAMGAYYAIEINPFEEDADAKCLYYNASLSDNRVLFQKVMTKKNNERVIETGYIDFDFDKNVMIMNFDEPIKRSFEVTVLAIGEDYEVDIDCRAGKIHPYAFSKSKSPPESTIAKIYRELDSRNIPRDLLQHISNEDC